MVAGVFLHIICMAFVVNGQTLPVGTPLLEDYYRRQQLKGERDSLRSFMVRPLYATADTPADSLFQTSVQTDSFFGGRGRFRVLPATLRQAYNVHHPYGGNDAGMIPARGYQADLTAGFFASLGTGNFSVTAQLQPEFVVAQNRDFATFPAGHTDSIWKAYYDVLNNIDNPEKFSGGSYLRFFPGQSSLRLNYKKLSLGVSTESLWWGPGIRNALVMSNNAPGFLHLTLNSRAPMKTFLGHFEWQLIGGILEESDVFPPDTSRTFGGQPLYAPKSTDGDRYINAMTISWQPKWVPNLFLGFSRAFYLYRSNLPHNLNGYLPVLTGFFKGAGNDDADIGRDQLLSFSFRWVLPKEKAEVYAEFGRNDHAQNSEDFAQEPEHSRAYVLGLHKMFETRKGREIEVLIEWTQTQLPSTSIQRAVQPWYVHYQTRHGYTNRGQVLGAMVGPGGNSQTLGLSWNRKINSLAFYFERFVHNNDFYYQAFTPMQKFDAHWVDLSLNAVKSWQHKQFLFSANLALIRSLNYQWRYNENPATLLDGKKDINNLSVGCSISYLFGK